MDKIYYERKLPHWQPPCSTFFLTYRLFGSIPKSTIKAIKSLTQSDLEVLIKIHRDPTLLMSEIYKLQNTYFKRFDKALDDELNGPYWLRQPEIASQIYDSLLFINSKIHIIHAFTIMSNHVHLLLTNYDTHKPLYRLMQSHKSFTAKQCNKILGRSGPFWEEESYDHFVRKPGEFQRITQYIIMNPVKAKQVTNWQDWPWTYVKNKNNGSEDESTK